MSESLIVNEDGEISCTVWVKRGGMLVIRHALDHDDPEHLYNLIVAKGLNPDEYGVKHPLEEEFADKSRSQLIEIIDKQRKELEAWAKAGVSGLLR